MDYSDTTFTVTIAIGEDAPDPEPSEIIDALYQGVESIDSRDAISVKLHGVGLNDSRKINDAESANLEVLKLAAKNGDLALIVAKHVETGEEHVLLAAIAWDGSAYHVTPYARMIDGNPFEVYEGPADGTLNALDERARGDIGALRDELRDLEGEGQFRGIPIGHVDSLTDDEVRERVAELRDDEED